MRVKGKGKGQGRGVRESARMCVCETVQGQQQWHVWDGVRVRVWHGELWWKREAVKGRVLWHRSSEWNLHEGEG